VSSVHASPAPRDHGAEFVALDRNGDGNISKSEATADKYMARAFSGLDEDHDGKLDREEAMRWLNN
jgi:Ca2+-binding EF-hand superfamily protein